MSSVPLMFLASFTLVYVYVFLLLFFYSMKEKLLQNMIPVIKKMLLPDFRV